MPEEVLRHHHIIVISASAGGVEALQALVSALPRGLAASFFVVVHISWWRNTGGLILRCLLTSLPMTSSPRKEPLQFQAALSLFGRLQYATISPLVPLWREAKP